MGYNGLTRKLLLEGYSAFDYPRSKYRLERTWNREDPYDNFYGGFEYQRFFIYEQVFRTPCGLQCKGHSCLTNLHLGGIEYCFEHDNALVECPYGKDACEQIPLELQSLKLRCKCPVQQVEEAYTYEGSVEGLLKLREDEIKREKERFILARNGRACEHHMHYNKETQVWEFHYDPATCSRGHCLAVTCGSECPVLGRGLDQKKGNVYYDKKLSFEIKAYEGTIFEGQRGVEIQKGVRVFSKPVSMDICNQYVRLCKDTVVQDVRLKYHCERFFAKYHGRYFEVDVFHIRAETKPSRDLLQDLKDMQDGVVISHASDDEKTKKAYQKERRRALKQKKLETLEKKILRVGYWNMEPHSLDRIHAEKWLGLDRIEALEEERKRLLEQEKNKPVQLSVLELFV